MDGHGDKTRRQLAIAPVGDGRFKPSDYAPGLIEDELTMIQWRKTMFPLRTYVLN